MAKVDRILLEEILPEKIRNRLELLGVEELGLEDEHLLYYIKRSTEWVQSAIGMDDIPKEAERSFVDFVCADVVLERKFGVQAGQESAEPTVERLQVGDASVTYADGGMSREQKELRLMNTLYDRAREVLLGYRKLRW